jgi:hypothetical protein
MDSNTPEPAPDAEQNDGRTTDRTWKRGWEAKFLAALATTGTVCSAAKKAKISRSTVYEARDSDPLFARAWDDAVEENTQILEAEAIRRASAGYVKPVYQRGELVGKVREYSDTLLIFLLKSRRPQVYRDNPKADSEQPGPDPSAGLGVLARLAALLAGQQAPPGGAAVPAGGTPALPAVDA